MELTNENYFSKEAQEMYLGFSSLKACDMENKGIVFFGTPVGVGCESREMAIKKGEWTEEESEVRLVGSYVHAYNESPEAFENFCEEYHDKIYKKNGKKYAAFIKADCMIDVLNNSEDIKEVNNGAREQIFIGELDGIKFKIMTDVLNLEENYFTDLKTTSLLGKKLIINDEEVDFFKAFHYDMQLALYSEIVYQNTGKHLDMHAIVLDKNKGFDHEVFHLGNHEDKWVGIYLAEIKEKLPRIMAVRNGKVKPRNCGKCKYCRSLKQEE